MGLQNEVGKDKTELEVHSCLYRGLLTNLPKEVMAYPKTPFPEQEKSFIPADEVLSYIVSSIRCRIQFTSIHKIRTFVRVRLLCIRQILGSYRARHEIEKH